jgi:hypothetical protein
VIMLMEISIITDMGVSVDQNFNGDFGGDYVGGNKYSLRLDYPDHDHPNAIECPQCWKPTWRLTPNCVRCEYDIKSHYEEVEKVRKIEDIKKRVIILRVITICLFSFGYLITNKFSPVLGVLLICVALVVFALAAKLESLI